MLRVETLRFGEGLHTYSNTRLVVVVQVLGHKYHHAPTTSRKVAHRIPVVFTSTYIYTCVSRNHDCLAVSLRHPPLRAIARAQYHLGYEL